MMKKAVIMLVLLVLAYSASAITIDLISPTDNYVSTSTDMTFSCRASEAAENLTLYHNITGWSAVETIVGIAANTEYSFTAVTGISPGRYIWNCMATEANNTQTFSASNFNFRVNNAPVSTEMPNIVWPEDNTNTTNLSMYFSDADGDALGYSYSSVSNIAVSISEGVATITPEANWYGNKTISFTASDGYANSTGNAVALEVLPVNDAPLLVSEIDNEILYLDGQKRIELDQHFSDPEGDAITYSAQNYTNINITIVNNEATITTKSNWTGIETVLFIAKDSYNATTTSNQVIIKVKERAVANRKPEITSTNPAQEAVNLTVDSSRTFYITKSDPDNDTLSVQWYVNSEPIENANSDNFSFRPDAEGSYKIRVAVTDGSMIDSYVWNVYAAAKEQPVANETPQAPATVEEKCGNGRIEEGENCMSCPADAACPEGYDCIEGTCTTIKSARNLLLLIVVLSAFIAAAVLVIYYYRKKQERILFTPKIEKVAEPKKEPKKKEGFLEGLPPKEKPRTVSDVLLDNYIKTCIAKGMDYETIKRTLVSVGWDEKAVRDAYERAKG